MHFSYTHFLVVEHWRPACFGLEELGYVKASVDLLELDPPLRRLAIPVFA
jgi:hypothetical protein